MICVAIELGRNLAVWETLTKTYHGCARRPSRPRLVISTSPRPPAIMSKQYQFKLVLLGMSNTSSGYLVFSHSFSRRIRRREVKVHFLDLCTTCCIHLTVYKSGSEICQGSIR